MNKIDFLAPRPEAVFDTEAYPNLWAFGAKDCQTGKKVIIHMRHGGTLDTGRIVRIIRNFRLYGFNSINYDWPMIGYALKGAGTEQLKQLNDKIIVPPPLRGLMPWEVEEQYDLSFPPFLDTIDLWNVAPSAAQKFSLKKYMGCMHSRWLKDLPYSPDTWLTDSQIDDVLHYLHNDLDGTDELRDEMKPQISLRNEISSEYNFDFRSKSDAQCGEAVVKLLAERKLGRRVYKPDIKPGTFKYEAPAYIQFRTPYMQDMFDKLLRSDFLVQTDGYVKLPLMFQQQKKKPGRRSGDEELDLSADPDIYEGGAEIKIGGNTYKMGIGGLHSQEKKASHFASDTLYLIDRDVTSYYPFLILRSGSEPDNMKGTFKDIFESLVIERVRCKRLSEICEQNGDPAGSKKWASRAESLKIFINGLFGKTGSPWSVVYAPRMMIQTTVTGQLSILMLIEDLTCEGFEVISANTDGFITKVSKNRKVDFDVIIKRWENRSALNTEETRYRSVHSRDVNNYVAFEENGKVKRKGAYAPGGRGVKSAFGLKKTPDTEICAEAAIEWLKDGTSIESTIRNCQNINKFVRVRKVDGGAMKGDEEIGKTVRYYFGSDEEGPLTYKRSGNRVPNSDGAAPCMVMPDELPGNIDYAWYEREAYAVLSDMGMEVIDPYLRGKDGFGLGRLEAQKTVHRIDWSTGIACCGRQRPSRRDLWVEYKSLPPSMKLCGKCEKASKV